LETDVKKIRRGMLEGGGEAEQRGSRGYTYLDRSYTPYHGRIYCIPVMYDVCNVSTHT
jgi:hypothetical protein